ncbi:MAG: hypothetical protein KKE23_03070 [Nanoarchaeota archaeon]|nr:hypothetical protein [Nanoarchaeota archaeon]
MAKQKGMNLILLTIILASLLLTGQTGCPQQAGIGTTTSSDQQYQSTSASSYGLDYSLIKGVGMLSEGSKVTLGETFNVGLHIENYDSKPRSGRACIRDDMDDAYGGVETACNMVLFNVREAQFDEKGNVVKAGSFDLQFPASGYYSYIKEFPLAQSTAKLFINSEYVQSSSVQTSVSVPQPTSGSLSITQDPSPVKISIEKTILSEENNYKVNLGINFNNQLSNSEIWTPDFKKKGITFNIQMGNYPIECKSQGVLIGDYIEMENKKFITCSALVPKEQITHPLLVNINYGVKLNKEFSFTIQKEATA